MSEVATSQPPPATDGGVPWGSFYTAPDGSAPAKPKLKPKAKPKAKRKRSAEPKPEAERVEQKGQRRRRGSLIGGSRSEDRRRSFRLRRPSSDAQAAAAPAPAPGPAEAVEPGLPPVAAPAKSRRYAEPHVLVAVVGGTIIALAALMIALLYMIGTAA